MACSGGYCASTCYTHNACSCNINKVCATESVTCAAKVAACAAKASYTWSNSPATAGATKINLLDITELRTNIRAEQARRSYNASTGAATTCTSQTTFSSATVFLAPASWTDLKTAIINLGAITEVGLTFTWSSVLTTDTNAMVVTPTEFRANLDAVYKKCVCNAKSNCGCNTYCGANAVPCTTNGTVCGCYGDCGCYY